MENVHFFYISIYPVLSNLIHFLRKYFFLRLNLVNSFDFNYVVVIVLILKHF